MTLQEKIEKQKQLLDEIPYPEYKHVLICENDAEFVYVDPVTLEGTCKSCGDTWTEEVRVRNL